MIKAAVLGSPITHSLSPVLHRAAYKYLGIEGHYEAIQITTAQLPSFLNELDESWTGFSLTMPLKEKVLELVAQRETLALRVASANTLIREEGGWRAFTTDVNGFRAAAAQHHVSDFSVVGILGSGATARAAAAAFDAEHRSMTVLHRSAHREISMRQAAPLAQIEFLDWDSPLPKFDLLINTTPHGVADSLVHSKNISVGGVLFEALYDPWPTLLLSTWKSSDLKCIDGLDLLVHQAIDQVALMTKHGIIRHEIAPIMRQAGLDQLLGRTPPK